MEEGCRVTSIVTIFPKAMRSTNYYTLPFLHMQMYNCGIITLVIKAFVVNMKAVVGLLDSNARRGNTALL